VKFVIEIAYALTHSDSFDSLWRRRGRWTNANSCSEAACPSTCRVCLPRV